VTPWLSIVIPTVGRPGLAHTLRSIRAQAPAEAVEVLVVGDTYGDDFAAALAPVPALCQEFEARYRTHGAEPHCWGQPQRDYGATQATGRWLAWTQDDNQYVDGALAAMQAATTGAPGPRLFRVEVRPGFAVWRWARLGLGDIDADCLLTPNDPPRLGRWGRDYTGDFAMIADTVRAWGGAVQWVDQLIARHGEA
jgi:hypothetical protein